MIDYETLPPVVLYAIPGFILLIIAEMAAVRFGAPGRYETRDAMASLFVGTGSRLAGILGLGAIGYGVWTFFYEHRLFDLPATWWTAAIAFIGYDFFYYWAHRIYHERRWFWADHVIHHSSQHYNLTTALRQGWTGNVSGTFVFYTPLALLGFHPLLLAFVGGLNLIYQFWIHTEIIDRMGPFEWVFNTPSHHRVHHATNPEYIDANYAGTLIIWDRMFGTFVPERREETPVYGIVKNLRSFNPLVIAFHEYRSILRDLLSARSLKDAWGFLWGPPGWSPDGSRMTSTALKERWRRVHGGEADEAGEAALQPAE
ncbi:MAG: sterol desaturase family protein [Pseudomonadota bacterium]